MADDERLVLFDILVDFINLLIFRLANHIPASPLCPLGDTSLGGGEVGRAGVSGAGRGDAEAISVLELVVPFLAPEISWISAITSSTAWR